jgi:hypothetical protein
VNEGGNRARVAVQVVALVLLAAACSGEGAHSAITPVALPGGSSADCTVTVEAGGDVSASVASAGSDAVICVPSGSYRLSAPVAPSTGQTIQGIGANAPTLACDAPLCFDGQGAGTGVTLANLILQGAGSAAIRTADAWVVTQVSVQTAADSGMKLQGANVTVRDVFAVSNGRFGIVAKHAVNLTIDGATIVDSPADPSFEIGLSGGLKLNSVSGASISGVDVRGGSGGAGIWIDNNTTDFTVSASSVEGVAHDAIRIEISCRGTVSESTVTDAGNVGLDVYNSHDVDLIGNTVSGAGTWAIRMLSNGRSSGPGGGACLQDGTFPTTSDTAESNTVTLREGVLVGADHQGGLMSDLAWSANRYTAPSCDAAVWSWWDGVIGSRVGFGGWEGFGQDDAGSCAAA